MMSVSVLRYVKRRIGTRARRERIAHETSILEDMSEFIPAILTRLAQVPVEDVQAGGRGGFDGGLSQIIGAMGARLTPAVWRSFILVLGKLYRDLLDNTEVTLGGAVARDVL